jgi:hypothetical protein
MVTMIRVRTPGRPARSCELDETKAVRILEFQADGRDTYRVRSAPQLHTGRFVHLGTGTNPT